MLYKGNLIAALKVIETKYFTRLERDFAYELYHQLRNLQLDIDVTAETPKGQYLIPMELINNKFFKDYFFSSVNFDLENNCYNRTPDLLFHEYKNKNRQILASEIKPLNKSDDLIYKDITKLMYYTKSSLNYKCGVQILFSPIENERKVNRLRNMFQKVLEKFPEIEIWIVYPKRVHVIWAGGNMSNQVY